MLMTSFARPLFFFFLLPLILLTACQREQKAKEAPLDLGKYVWAYSNGAISKQGPVQIRLARDYFSDEQAEPAIPSDFLSFSPKINGSYSWNGARTILFTPNKWLQPGKHYLATANLNKLYPEIEANLASFQFNFKTFEQNLQVDELSLAASEKPNAQTVMGKITSWDVAEAESIEKSLQLKIDGTASSQIVWEHSSNGLEHNFYIKDIDRGDDSRKVELSISGTQLGVKNKITRSINLASKNAFECLNVYYQNSPNPQVIAVFSDPVKASQSFTGLVEIEGTSKALKYQVDNNELKIFWSEQLSGQNTVRINPGILSTKGIKLKKRIEKAILLEEPKPQIKLVGNGVIIPGNNNFSFPFESINLQRVQVEIFKIFNNNVTQFFQNNNYQGDYQLQQVGRLINAKAITLINQPKASDNNKWKRYALDLSDLINDDPEAIYQIRIGFGPQDILNPCSQATPATPTATFAADQYKSFWKDNYYGYQGYYDGYDWRNRENPCKPEYYNRDKFIARNVITSNFGLIGKFGENNQCVIHISDLSTLESVANAEIKFYDYQQQLMLTTNSDGAGQVNTQLERPPFLIVATKGLQKGYLKMVEGNPLPLSRFEVEGAKVKKGLKGFAYGERGVWRPGDTLFLNFMVQDATAQLPKDAPVTCKVFNATNQPVYSRVSTASVGNIYNFPVPTQSEAPTGNWRAEFLVGAAKFTKNLMIETVKPNRIKVKLEIDSPLDQGKYEIKLAGSWLHGAPAKNLKAKVEGRLNVSSFSLAKYSNYTFIDPARKNVNNQSFDIFDGQLGVDGQKAINYSLENNLQYPGKMRLNLRTRIFEKGGDFSEDNYSQILDPFSTYVGLSTPNSDRYWDLLALDERHAFDLVALDKEGKAQSGRQLSVGVYEVGWSWWWDQDERNIAQFSSSKHVGALSKKQNIVTDAKGQATFNYTPDYFGRYLIRVCDEESGHCAGNYFYAGNNWYGNGEEDREGAAMLFFNTDQEKYEVGDRVTLNIPTTAGGKALISIEDGAEVISSNWINTEEGQTTYSFHCTAEMVPNIYAHVSLMQSVDQPNKDIPLRMYGVIPISIADEKNKLEPTIKTADVYRPNEKVNIEVAEKKGRPLAYTLAVVEEGLLDLTRYKTPNPATSFLAKEALGVKTWDMYNQILTYGGGAIDRLLAIGGDGAIDKSGDGKKTNRFDPVVKHLGPFYLDKKEKARHEINLPNYIGSVRVMVVALADNAYGSAEKAVPVRKPLMVLGTLPRTLAVGDEISIPINVFAMEDQIKDVSVSIREINNLASATSSTSQQLYFEQPGDDLAIFKYKIGDNEGPAKFLIEAKSGNTTSTQEINVQITHPLIEETTFQDGSLAGNANEAINYQLTGIAGSNKAYLEIGTARPLNLDRHLKYLLQYPHGCLEQTTSKAFAQINLDKITNIDAAGQERIANNTRAAIRKLQNFQIANGGFSYWAGHNRANDWSTSYAGHYLLAAKARGFLVPDFLLDRWQSYQSTAAQQWRKDGEYSRSQAYRLYTLALSGSPELGAMNRLRETKKITTIAKWLLAGAYAEMGQLEVAKEIARPLSLSIDPYFESYNSYGSALRDQGIILNVLMALEDEGLMVKAAANVSKNLSSSNYYNTHAIAFGLAGLGKYYDKFNAQEEAKITFTDSDGKQTEINFMKPVYSMELKGKNPGAYQVNIKNEKGIPLFYRIVKKGKPRAGEEKTRSENLKMNIDYVDAAGNEVDVSSLGQGTDFVARISVKNVSGANRYRLDNMALTQIFPPGWEITNTRMSSVTTGTTSSQIEYQDFRDDRVFTYFNLRGAEEKTFELQLSATYLGRYYLPGVLCENMYSENYRAQVKGQWVEVVEF